MNYLLAFCLLFSSLAAQETIPTQQMMTPQERASIGIDGLNPQQKQAFEEWAARWTHHVIEMSPSYRAGTSLSTWVQAWPSYANPTKTELTPNEVEQRQMANQSIDRVRNNGEYVDLRDGSSWHISPFFRYLTGTWQRGQTVEVSGSRNSLHPWQLHNLALGQVAEADLAVAASATGKKEPEPENYYNGAIPVSSATTSGDLLTLGDGTVWKIAPMDMAKVRYWRPNDRVRVEPSDNYLYKFSLTNLDNGEVSLANKPRS
jgi:hypothetical protein